MRHFQDVPPVSTIIGLRQKPFGASLLNALYEYLARARKRCNAMTIELEDKFQEQSNISISRNI